MSAYQLKDYDFFLPDAAIAKFPNENRDESRLLHINRATGKCSHRYFHELDEILTKDDLLVFNDTKVRKARFYAKSSRGKEHEIVFLSLPDNTNKIEAIISARKKCKPGDRIIFPENVELTFLYPKSDFAVFRVKGRITEGYFENFGQMPIPPYLKRKTQSMDDTRYQSIFAKKIGACAAPTASLHFSPNLFQKIRQKGVKSLFISLYIGFGTFSPIREKDIRDHKMHEESFELSWEVLEKIFKQKKNKGRIIPVGTTSLRLLESLCHLGFGSTDNLTRQQSSEKIISFANIDSGKNEQLTREFKGFQGKVRWQQDAWGIRGNTSIFIYPGYEFQLSDGLITNFHTPKSSLLMLVSAFYDREKILKNYSQAVTQGYRFFSYGDAMFLE